MSHDPLAGLLRSFHLPTMADIYADTLQQAEQNHWGYDHLVPNGGNHLGNIVLACGRCNEYEKLNTDWDDYLRKKATTSKLYGERRSRILDWQKFHKRDHSQVNQVLLEQSEDCIRRAVKSFDRELSKLRAAKHLAENRR